mmetsp:Transcript_35622/g.58402  ORF Transcript_35622/g.58402 Transcript_35622/m.58402 type:complete len:340 (-) Transcript_35622:161-1180(-)
MLQILLQLLLRVRLAIVPLVHLDLLDVVAILGVRMQHALQQILQHAIELASALVRLPKQLNLGVASGNMLVAILLVLLLLGRHNVLPAFAQLVPPPIGLHRVLEGREASVRGEQNNAERKNVALVRVLLAFQQLWRQVALRAARRLHLLDLVRVVLVHKRGGEPEVRNLEHIRVVEQQVLRLQVAMRNAQRVHRLQSVDHLVEVRARRILVEAAGEHEEVEEFAAAGKLQHRHNALGATPVRLWVLGVLVKLDELNDILVVHLLHHVELANQLLFFRVGNLATIIRQHNLERRLLTRLAMNAQLHFTVTAHAQCIAQHPIVDHAWRSCIALVEFLHLEL